jgi:hypothetical protein
MNRKNNIFLLILLSWIFLAGHQVTAQTRFSVSQITVYDQNIFRNYLEASDWVNQTSLDFQYNFQLHKIPVRFDYTGDLNLFYYYNDRLSHSHQASLESFLTLNKNFVCNLGTAFQLRKFKPDFNFYDYQTALAYIQFRWDAWQSTPMSLGYRFRNRDYANLTQLSYREHHGFFQIKHFFPTRTTFIAELNWGQKVYTNPQTVEQVVIVTPKNSGKGRGQSHGRGHQMMPSDTSIVAYNMTALKAEQWHLSLKFAQSIFLKTGMSIEYIRQSAPANNIRYLTGLEYSYSKDDELYDDPYSYSSNELEFTITQMLPWSSSLKIYANLLDKKYLYWIGTDSTLSLNQADEKRNDQQNLFGLILQKNFKLNKNLKNLSFYISVNYLSNQSNDLYFDFKGIFVHSGFEFLF